MNVDQLRTIRREKDEFFKTDAYSPLMPEQQDHFNGLRYYEPNAALDLTVHVARFAVHDEVAIETSGGDVQRYRRYGEFSFTVEGETVRLTIYAGPHGYFLPFVDSGAGVETYAAGRYLEPTFLGVDRFHVDFNLAYNPYCAYSEGWSCPITPTENHLTVAIRAGEMLPTDGWADSHQDAT